MARPEDRHASEHDTPKDQSSRPDPALQAYRRLREAMEDDEAREALKSLHERQDRRPGPK